MKQGEYFEGIWHTAIVAYGKEWYFSKDGIDFCEPVRFYFNKNCNLAELLQIGLKIKINYFHELLGTSEIRSIIS